MGSGSGEARASATDRHPPQMPSPGEMTTLPSVDHPTSLTSRSARGTVEPSPTQHALPLTIITPARGWFDWRLQQLWRYRDLISLFVWRDFVSVYKQTILGPAWHVIRPLITTLIFTVVFSRMAGLSTDGAPPFLFYMVGNVAWTYFCDLPGQHVEDVRRERGAARQGLFSPARHSGLARHFQPDRLRNPVRHPAGRHGGLRVLGDVPSRDRLGAADADPAAHPGRLRSGRRHHRVRADDALSGS